MTEHYREKIIEMVKREKNVENLITVFSFMLGMGMEEGKKEVRE